MKHRHLDKKYKMTPEQNKLWKQIYKDMFSHAFPINSDIYDFLISQGINIPKAKLIKSANDEAYYIYSFITFNGKIKQKRFFTSKKRFKAIKAIFGSIPVFFVKNKNLKYIAEKNTLYVGDGRVQFKPNSDRERLVKYMFDGKALPPWTPLELADVLEYSETSDDKKLYQYIYGKIKMLNRDIDLQVGLEDFIITNKSNFTINPTFSHFLHE